MPDRQNPRYTLTRHAGEEMLAMMNVLVPVYLAAYSGPPYFNRGVNTEEGFRARTAVQALRPGAVLVTAATGPHGAIAGSPSGSRWNPAAGGGTRPNPTRR